MAWSSTQKYTAEFIGTFGLLLSVSGAALFTSVLEVDFAARVLLISLALGAGVIGMIYAVGDISGGHFNPAVTVAMWATGRLPARDVVPYVIAQVLGGLLAVGIIVGVLSGLTGVSLSTAAGANGFASQGYTGNGSPYLYSAGAVFLLEVTLTFFLVFVILFATRPDSSAKNLAGLGIGLTLIMTNLVAIPVDGASVNPARSFAPAVLSAFYSPGQWAIKEDWIFWVAPIAGALFAAVLARILTPRNH
ncbi:MAG: aquaporin [Thermoplasmata archaeon]